MSNSEHHGTGRAVMAYAMLGMVALAYWPSFLALHQLWLDTENRTYTHGYLVAAVSAWLLLRAYPALKQENTRAEPAALLLLASLSLAWLVAWRASIQDLHLLLLPFLALSALLASSGWRVMRRLAFPILFLVTALPIWGLLNPLLRWLTVKAVSALIWLTGLTAYVEGDRVFVPAGTFVIEYGCGGLHFFIVAIAIGALFGELGRDTANMRVRWIAGLAVLSMVMNWVRVFVIIVAGYLTDMQHYLVTVDHYVFGWFVFGAAMLLFLWFASRVPARRLQPAAAGVPVGARNPGAWIAAAACAATLPCLAYAADLARVTVDQVELQWPDAAAGWVALLPAGKTGWEPHYAGADSSGMHRYGHASGMEVEAYGAAYGRQRQGAELVGYENSLVGARDELRVLDGTTVVGTQGEWRQLTVSDQADGNSIIRYRYLVGGRYFIRGITTQLWYGLTSLRNPSPSALIAVRAHCVPDCGAAMSALDEFPATMLPTLEVK